MDCLPSGFDLIGSLSRIPDLEDRLWFLATLFFYLLCPVSVLYCGLSARRKGVDFIIWSTLGLLFGPVAAIAIAFVPYRAGYERQAAQGRAWSPIKRGIAAALLVWLVGGIWLCFHPLPDPHRQPAIQDPAFDRSNR